MMASLPRWLFGSAIKRERQVADPSSWGVPSLHGVTNRPSGRGVGSRVFFVDDNTVGLEGIDEGDRIMA